MWSLWIKRAQNFALRGEFLSARAERNQRAAKGKRNRQERLRRPCLHAAYPWTPFCGGRQLGCRGNDRKGAGGSADWSPFYYRCR